MAKVILETGMITDWASFHTQSQIAFGFPAFYGKNLNAWIDCLTYLPEGDGMSSFVLGPGELLTIELPNCDEFIRLQPEIFQALNDCVAHINQRYILRGDVPRLVITTR